MADDGEVTKMDLVCDESPDDKPLTISENGKSNNESDLRNGINSDNAENINGQLEPPVKKFKSEINTGEENTSPVPDDPKNEKDLKNHVCYFLIIKFIILIGIFKWLLNKQR